MAEYEVRKPLNKFIVKCPYYTNVSLIECQQCIWYQEERFYVESGYGKVVCKRKGR